MQAPFTDTGMEIAGDQRVLICRDCARRLARTFKIGTAAASAALLEAEAERHELERRIADSDVEREQLQRTVEELRDKLPRSEFRWRQIGEQTSALHALASQAVEA